MVLSALQIYPWAFLLSRDHNSSNIARYSIDVPSSTSILTSSRTSIKAKSAALFGWFDIFSILIVILFQCYLYEATWLRIKPDWFDKFTPDKRPILGNENACQWVLRVRLQLRISVITANWHGATKCDIIRYPIGYSKKELILYLQQPLNIQTTL